MKNPTAKQKLSDIIVAVSWGDIARNYFKKSPSWLYHKLDGIDGNGKPSAMSDKEIEMLQNALYDLSDRIRNSAMSLSELTDARRNHSA
ncbi:MAG: DUF5053 domain-containing protein [Bacteroidaceae bacterium]|nr:DUF5053 domain-containing protein [Bacteroidaceae bacterium]